MGQCRSPSVSPSRQAASSVAQVLEELSLFQQYHQDGNPFEMHIDNKEEETEDVLASNGVRLHNQQKSQGCKSVLFEVVVNSNIYSSPISNAQYKRYEVEIFYRYVL